MHTTHQLKVGAIASGFSKGVLGAFIQDKLKDHVEPTRAGTPKGEAIGLSRKKFYAALLSLTSLDLRKQAKVIGVSYGVLRKWRTEESLLEEVRKLEKEFLDGPFIYAANFSMDLLLNPDMKVEVEQGLDLESIQDKRNLIGFEDAEFYSVSLVVAIKRRFEEEALKAVTDREPVKKVLASLPWARPLG